MICQVCGMENENEAICCANCGNEFAPAPAVTVSNDTCATTGIIGKVVGICALIFSCASFVLGVFATPAMVMSIVGIVFNAVVKSKSAQLGLFNEDAKSGMTFSIIGAIVIAANYLLSLLLVGVIFVLYFGLFFMMIPLSMGM